MLRSGSRLLACLLLAAVVLPGTGVARAADLPIQPGARMHSSIGACTMNWIFRDADVPPAEARLYVGTAAHCVSGAGARVRDAGGRDVGITVFSRLWGDDDVALVRIDPSRYPDVNPSLRHWGGPTGVASYTRTGFMAPLRIYGNGVAYGSNAVTRPRQGLLYYDDAKVYRAELPVAFGDSGGPVLDATTGEALGVIARLGGVVTILEGSTVQRFLQLLAEAGFDVELVTAPYAGL